MGDYLNRGGPLYKGPLDEKEKQLLKQVITRDNTIFPTANVTDFDHPILRRFVGLNLISYDLGTAIKLIGHYKSIFKQNSVSGDVLYGIWSSVIISYSKCYNRGELRGFFLDAKDVYKDRDTLLEYHNQVMEARNKYYAHLGADYLFSHMIKVELDLTKRQVKAVFYSASFNSGPNLEENKNDADTMYQLVDLSIKYTFNAIRKMKPKVQEVLSQRFDSLTKSWQQLKKDNNL